MYSEGRGIWKGLSVTSFLMSAYSLWRGYDKMFHYSNSSYEPHNAYVGGDAYNFIISPVFPCLWMAAGRPIKSEQNMDEDTPDSIDFYREYPYNIVILYHNKKR